MSRVFPARRMPAVERKYTTVHCLLVLFKVLITEYLALSLHEIKDV